MNAALLLLLLLCACSGDYAREKPAAEPIRGGTITDLHKYCLEFPRDAACNEKEGK
jgi:hypothetical protein